MNISERVVAVTVSADGLTVAKTQSGPPAQSLAYATVGFSSGVHCWEFKIEQVCSLLVIFTLET